MNPKQTVIRDFGQRSIASSFLSRSSNPFKNIKEDVSDKATKRDSPVSLSDFLDRKLNRTSVLPRRVQGKSSPFSTPVGSKNDGGSIDEHTGIKNRQEEQRSGAIDKVIFEQFKHTRTEKGDTLSPTNVNEVENANEHSVNESRKRRNPFEGSLEKHTTQKPFVILGADSKFKQKRRKPSAISNEKAKPHYNHCSCTLSEGYKMQMVLDGGITPWKVLIVKKWAMVMCGKVLALQHLVGLSGTDFCLCKSSAL